MMNRPLTGKKVAILIANGFSESDMTKTQRALLDEGANVRIVSAEQGLVCGWNDNGWGHHFAVDANIRSALAADYAMLVIPGGQRSLDKLRLTEHTRRFINGFMAADKPVAVFDDAIQILVHGYDVAGKAVSCSEEYKDVAEQAGAVWQSAVYTTDANLLTGSVSDDTRLQYIAKVVDFFTGYGIEQQQAGIAGQAA